MAESPEFQQQPSQPSAHHLPTFPEGVNPENNHLPGDPIVNNRPRNNNNNNNSTNNNNNGNNNGNPQQQQQQQPVS